jgi:hypothetical protein
MKTCSKCGAVKPIEAFPKGEARCKECGRAWHAKYRAEHPEERKAAKAKYYAGHREECKARKAKYDAEHPEHPEKRKARHAKYYAGHREECLERSAKYYAEHLEECKAAARTANIDGITRHIQAQINAFTAATKRNADNRKFAATLGEKRALLEDDPDLADQD